VSYLQGGFYPTEEVTGKGESGSDRPVTKYPLKVHNVAIGDRRLRGISTDRGIDGGVYPDKGPTEDPSRPQGLGKEGLPDASLGPRDTRIPTRRERVPRPA
jgi:hypothetical protein